MCTFKQALKFLLKKLKGVEFGAINMNGEKRIVESDKLHKLNILIRDEMGESGKISIEQVQKIIDMAKSLGRFKQVKPPISPHGPYKYFNAKNHYGTKVFDDDSKLLISVSDRVQLPSFYKCLSYI